MARTRSMTRNQKHDDDDDASSHSRKMLRTSRWAGTAPWSDLDHNVLFSIMMRLAIFDIVTFSGVCKSWRSLALSNWKAFMSSKPPMTIRVADRVCRRYCYLQEVEGRKFKTILPNFADGFCIGLSCGYLIFFSNKTRVFWLMNPITKHQLHFHNFPKNIDPRESAIAVLVFSPSIFKWVFAVKRRCVNDYGIWFSISGGGAWNHVLYSIGVIDIFAFNGKICTLNSSIQCPLSQLILNPEEPKLTVIETKDFPGFFRFHRITSSDDVIYVTGTLEERYIVLELDSVEMKWVSCEKKMGDKAIFISDHNTSVVVKLKSWADPRSPYWRYADGFLCSCCSGHDYELSGKTRFFRAKMWYIPHECLNLG